MVGLNIRFTRDYVYIAIIIILVLRSYFSYNSISTLNNEINALNSLKIANNKLIDSLDTKLNNINTKIIPKTQIKYVKITDTIYVIDSVSVNQLERYFAERYN